MKDTKAKKNATWSLQKVEKKRLQTINLKHRERKPDASEVLERARNTLFKEDNL